MVMFGLWLVTVVLGSAACLGVVAVLNRARPCPTCEARALECIDGTMPHVHFGRSEKCCEPFTTRHYRCSACAAEFFRQDSGALVGKQAWEAGARDTIPAARLLT